MFKPFKILVFSVFLNKYIFPYFKIFLLNADKLQTKIIAVKSAFTLARRLLFMHFLSPNLNLPIAFYKHGYLQ